MGDERRRIYQDKSSAIAAGNKSQTLCEENFVRESLIVQNVSADILWIDFDKDAVQAAPSLKLLPNTGLAWDRLSGFVPTSRLTIIGPNPAAAFTVKEA